MLPEGAAAALSESNILYVVEGSSIDDICTEGKGGGFGPNGNIIGEVCMSSFMQLCPRVGSRGEGEGPQLCRHPLWRVLNA